MERDHGPVAPGYCQFWRKTGARDGSCLLESNPDDDVRTGGSLVACFGKRPLSSMVYSNTCMAEDNHLRHSGVHHIPGCISRYTTIYIFSVLAVKLNHPLRYHGVCNFDKTTDICTVYIIDEA